jgi:glucokinase
VVSFAIGIDIGGTKIAVGIVDEYGKAAVKSSLHTDPSLSPLLMIDRVVATIHELVQQSAISPNDIIGIGIGAPGPLNPADGSLTCPPNLPFWWGFRIVDAFRNHFSYPIQMENDATAAALAEKWIGAAKSSDHFIFLTVSTGIGAGIFMHGKLLTGSSGNAGDIGHMVIDPSAGTCICGQQGCFEWVASGTAISRQGSELLGRSITSQEVFAMAEGGHRQLQQLVEQTYRYIGMGCVSLINIFDPDTFVIGGGVAQVGASLFDAVSAYVSKFALNPAGRNTSIVPALLNQDAGLIGAAALIHMKNYKG